MDNPGKRYVLKIKDLPIDERPREKMLKCGPSVLSISELLAVILNTGTRKESVMEICRRVMKDYGEGNIMSQKNPATLASDMDIPIVKASQIVACAELGRRFFQKNDFGAPVVRTAREIFDYVKDMRGLSKEHLRGIYLNAHYKVIHDEVISIGTVDTNLVHPREVFKPAIEYSAAAVILVHNHPSGDAEPSENDILVTEKLVKAGKILGIDLIDHIIVTRGDFFSIPIH